MEKENTTSKIVAIASGKGGVGKTTVAVNLSLCLARRGRRTLLVDADMALGNVDLIANITSSYNISDVIDGRKQLKDIIHIGPEGLELICASSGQERLANLTDFQKGLFFQQLTQLCDEFQSVIIDTPAGISTNVIDLCQTADEVVVVTTCQPASITDAYATIKTLNRRRYEHRISLLVNSATSIEQGKRTYHQIAKVARQFLELEIHYAGTIAGDAKIALADRTRKPFILSHPDSPGAKCLVSLAERITASEITKSRNEGFFRQVAKLFS